METWLKFKKAKTDITDEGTKHKIILEGSLGSTDDPQAKVKMELGDISPTSLPRILENLGITDIEAAIEHGLDLHVVTEQSQSSLEDHT